MGVAFAPPERRFRSAPAAPILVWQATLTRWGGQLETIQHASAGSTKLRTRWIGEHSQATLGDIASGTIVLALVDADSPKDSPRKQ
jgi:hypothetical protein